MNKKKTNINTLSTGYVSAKGAAKFLGVSLNFLYKLTSAHRVPFYKPFGKHICFNVDELNQMVAQGRIATDAELQAEKGGNNDNA